MDAGSTLSRAAALIADRSRAVMLSSLAGGESRPACELAMLANVSPQTASWHLSLLVGAGFLTVTPKGRNKFYRLRGPAIATALESLAGISEDILPPKGIAERRAPELVFARTCYDHLAGKLGVAICERAFSSRYIHSRGEEIQLTGRGEAFFRNLGLGIGSAKTQRRRFAYACLDWSQRSPHIGGAFGAAILNWLFASKAIARCRGTRAVRVTEPGLHLLQQAFAIRISRNRTAISQ